MKRILVSIVALSALNACAPGEVEYCRSFGVEGTSEYGKCLDYYFQQQNAFQSDRGFCELEANNTYPPSLYDTGGLARSYGGFGGYGHHGYYGGGNIIHVPPNHAHNMQVDALRMRIIEPCMQARGWNSGSSWQAGRHAATTKKKAAKSTAKLPWLK